MDNKKRRAIQGIATLLQNANIKGFFTGKIYQGQTKNVCVPGFNCYSCPGAVGACPIGSLQNTLSSYKFKFPYYVLGLIFFFGTLLGRLICGFICPFGFIQDPLHKIPFPKKIKTFKGDKLLRKLKYIVLIVMVIILPIVFKLTPVFCKYLCPSGTLAGILLSLSDTKLFVVLGNRFAWKASILAIVVLLSILISRPFCKYLCPLGALYAPFNKISVIQMECDSKKCVACKACHNICDMCVDPSITPNSTECIRCGKCISACPVNALKMGNIFQNHSNRKRTIVRTLN